MSGMRNPSNGGRLETALHLLCCTRCGNALECAAARASLQCVAYVARIPIREGILRFVGVAVEQVRAFERFGWIGEGIRPR